MKRPFYVQVSYGAWAHDCLAAHVKLAKQENPLAPVTVVAPSYYAKMAAVRALGSRNICDLQNIASPSVVAKTPGVAGVLCVTMDGLAEQLAGGRMAAARRRPVSKPVIAAAIRSILRKYPGYFASVATHHTTERRLVDAHLELSGVTDRGLTKLAEQSARAADVVRIHRSVTNMLTPDFYNHGQLLDEATTAVGDTPELVEALGAVIVFLPQCLGSGYAQLLRSISDTVSALEPVPALEPVAPKKQSPPKQNLPASQ